MATTLTLDPFGQLTAGLRYVLQQALLPTGLVTSPQQIRAGWPDPQMVAALATGSFNPVVSVVLGNTVPSPQQPGTTSNKNLQGPPDQNGLVTVLIETVRLQTPITFCVTAGGARGKQTRAVLGTLISNALTTNGLQSLQVTLPDSLEQATSAWTPALALFGNKAQVTYQSESFDDRLDSRAVYRLDLLYQAIHSRYLAQTETLIGAVLVTKEIGVTVVPAVPPLPAPPP